MRKPIILAVFFMALLMTGTAMAEINQVQMRRQADSEYRIAVKAYKKAVRNHGDSLTGITRSEREEICRKVSSALFDNRWQADHEDVLTAPQYRRQTQTLENYSKELCTD